MRQTPQEARIKEKVCLTLAKLDEPDSSWLDANSDIFYITQFQVHLYQQLLLVCS